MPNASPLAVFARWQRCGEIAFGPVAEFGEDLGVCFSYSKPDSKTLTRAQRVFQEHGWPAVVRLDGSLSLTQAADDAELVLRERGLQTHAQLASSQVQTQRPD